MTSDQAGAACANHTEVLRLVTTGRPGEEGYRVCGAVVQDMLTGEEYEIRAKQVHHHHHHLTTPPPLRAEATTIITAATATTTT